MLKEHGLNKDMPADWKWGGNPLCDIKPQVSKSQMLALMSKVH